MPMSPIVRAKRGRLQATAALPALALLAASALPAPAFANNYGESLAWQFRTPSDLAAQMSMLDLIAKRRGGYYAPPIYNTAIDRLYNCSVGASAIGNEDAQSALANSPSTTGAAADATGNASSGSATRGSTDNSQGNSGAIGAGVTGATSTTVHGTSWQVLNSSQANSGNQSASVTGSTACALGALN